MVQSQEVLLMITIHCEFKSMAQLRYIIHSMKQMHGRGVEAGCSMPKVVFEVFGITRLLCYF